MLAFPLLELGRMEDAEIAAKKGFLINNQDPWSQHAVSYLPITNKTISNFIHLMLPIENGSFSVIFYLQGNEYHF